MGTDWTALLVLLLMLVLPAIVIFVVLNMLRIRREKMHRQRITKKRSHPVSEDKPKA